MSRIPMLERYQLSPSGQETWDLVVKTRGAGVVTAQGFLRGPFNAFVHAPDVGSQLASLGSALRFGTSLGTRLTELAIITVAAGWRAEYEWMSHSKRARDAGIPNAVVDAIGRHETPSFGSDLDRAVYVVARDLVNEGSVSEADFGDARGHLGNSGMMELVSLCGYYTMIGFILNAFDVALPSGEACHFEPRE